MAGGSARHFAASPFSSEVPMTMMFSPTRLETTIGGNSVILETGRLANQADGAVWIQSGGTVVLVTVCTQALAEEKGFFPLVVDYQEMAYAAGRIPGSYFRREIGRPSEREVLVCRLIEGNYPNYNAVIPTANPNKVLVDRIELVNGIKRVAVCSNPTTNLIRMDIADNRINLTAQDIDFSVSANETISCSYEGQNITIGFKSTFLVEILSNIDTPTIVIELADSTRAGVFKPVYDDKQSSATLMLLMPMMINA